MSAGMSESGVQWRIEAPNVAVVTLNRPPVNALNRATRAALIGAFDALEADEDVRAIVLTATGKVFCAGADIKEKAALAGEPANYAARQPADPRRLLLHPRQHEAGHRGRAGRGARSRLRARRLLRHNLRRRERLSSACPRSTSARAAGRASCGAFCHLRRSGG